MDIPPGLIDSAAILRTRAGTDFIHREFRAGRLVRIRRGFYVSTTDWIRAHPSERFAWSTAAVARTVKGAVLCGQTAALASGLPTLRTPASVELATTLPGRSGTRRSPLLVLGEDTTAKEVREKRSYPLRYCLKAAVEPVRQGECWWPEQRVVGEFDGKGKYLDAALRGAVAAEEAVYREKLREDRIRGLGYGFVRWGWADVDNPDRLRRRLLAAGLRPRIPGSLRIRTVTGGKREQAWESPALSPAGRRPRLTLTPWITL